MILKGIGTGHHLFLVIFSHLSLKHGLVASYHLQFALQ
jgi:hypothetical protein